MILKIQRPLTSNLPPDQEFAMAYNRSRSYTAYLPMADVEDLFADGSAKIYHMAKRRTSPPGVKTFQNQGVTVSLQSGDAHSSDGVAEYLKIGKRVADQSW